MPVAGDWRRCLERLFGKGVLIGIALTTIIGIAAHYAFGADVTAAVPGVQGEVEAKKAGDSRDAGVDGGKEKVVRLVSPNGKPIGGGVA